MAHKKAAWSAENLRNSNPKYRWVKLFGGEKAKAGNIIIRQKGTKFRAGEGTHLSKDYTIIALKEGIVDFKIKKGKSYISVNNQ